MDCLDLKIFLAGLGIACLLSAGGINPPEAGAARGNADTATSGVEQPGGGTTATTATKGEPAAPATAAPETGNGKATGKDPKKPAVITCCGGGL